MTTLFFWQPVDRFIGIPKAKPSHHLQTLLIKGNQAPVMKLLSTKKIVNNQGRFKPKKMSYQFDITRSARKFDIQVKLSTKG